MANRNEVLALVIILAACFLVAGLASFATRPSIPTWYEEIEKPSWTPPNWLFGPVWTALYAAMAVAAWLVWKKAGWTGGHIPLFCVQLALNLAWSFIFFGLHRPGLAFVEIALLLVAIAATAIKFATVSKTAALLMAPYLVWVGYAAALNFAIWRANR